MYDGVKLECKVTQPGQWRKALALVGRFAEQTGEVLPLPAEAARHALRFIQTPTLTGNRYTIQGSLHRYYNQGGENDNDYTLAQVKETINELKNTYSIDPAKTKVINFEFGVNITLPVGQDAQAYQKYLVSAQFKAFEKLNPKRPMVGYIAEFNEFAIKIYDKGYQSRTGATNQIRVEIKVNRSRWLDQFNFIKGKDLLLTDLINPVNIKILGDILENKIRSLILTPRQIDITKLSSKQIQTFFECRDARSWEEWTSKQRERKRAQLSAIFKKVNQPDPVDALAKLVISKWLDVSQDVADTGKERRQKATISSVLVEGIRGLFNFLLNRHEYNHTKVLSFVLYLPRGRPIRNRARSPTTNTGFKRWIDLNCRDPTIQTPAW